MKILVGLGNIGEKYKNTRHNCGFFVIEEFLRTVAKEENMQILEQGNEKLKALVAKFEYRGEQILTARPLTLMNLSGQSVQAILNFYKESPKNLIVIYDDIDLPLGNIRIREKGSAGTHNGMKSIIGSIGTEDFIRIRIGIESRGESAPAEQDIFGFVLSDFTKKEAKIIKRATTEATGELKKLISA